VRALLGALALTLLLTTCSVSSPGSPPRSAGPTSSASPTGGTHVEIHKIAPFPGNARFDYQIGGPYEPDASVAVVDRDRHEQPVAGRYNVCYVNAFQTQPEESDLWTGQHPDLLVRHDGRVLTDPDWPGEHLLDTSTAAKRAALLAVVGPWIDGCAERGFDAVEPDNLDSWTRSRGVLTRQDNLAFAKLLAQRAHLRGLLIGQKNTSELGVADRTQVRFDFAVAEECQVHDECAAYTDAYGDQVVEIEYTDNPRSAYENACRARGARISIVLRDREVVPRGRPGYASEAC
jgi:hypothetical protein